MDMRALRLLALSMLELLQGIDLIEDRAHVLLTHRLYRPLCELKTGRVDIIDLPSPHVARQLSQSKLEVEQHTDPPYLSRPGRTPHRRQRTCP